MSDVFEGPGWWLASDGKWYAPHLHHDPDYRAQFAAPPSTPKAEPDPEDAPPSEPDAPPSAAAPEPTTIIEEPTTVDTTPIDVPGSETAPAAAASAPESARRVPTPGSVAEMLRGIEVPDEPEPARGTPVSEILQRAERLMADDDTEPTTTIRPPAVPPAEPVEPVVEQHADTVPSGEPAAPIDLSPTGTTVVEETSARPARARLELGRLADPDEVATVRSETETDATTSPVSTVGLQNVDDSPGTQIVHVGPAVDDYPELMDRLVAAALFVSGVAIIVGTFMVWERIGSTGQSGWELGEGVATVIAGVVGSAAAGPIFVGYRHVIPRAMAIVCGLVALVVVTITGVRVASDADATASSVGGGFWIVLIGALAMLVTGIADRTRILNR